MSETIKSEALADSEKPVQALENVQFPPFPEPTDDDFEEDISQEERAFYLAKFKDLNTVTQIKIHCTSCDRHLGLCPKNESRMKTHPMLRTLVCNSCHSFYNSGEFEKGEDGSELYCRWCGQGGQVYCCSDCEHVFCAKCIKRNLGLAKIKEIEELEDWKCFNCNYMCLRDLRAICWAALRYCDLKNRIAHKTEDGKLKEAYLQDCAEDHSDCCKSRSKRKEKLDAKKRDIDAKKSVASAVSKLPPTIQVKKFASINMNDTAVKQEGKKAQKRSASPKTKQNIILKNPISVASKMGNTFNVTPIKKFRLPTSNLINPIRIMDMNGRKGVAQNTFIKIRPKNQYQSIYNGMASSSPFNNVYSNDNINLSIDSLTQGLDVSAMSSMVHSPQSELVCTPDFPMEPLCEVLEDNTDDDVQCITPAPANVSKGPSLSRQVNLADVPSDNIIQMTENDVTVNTVTGGLKFRVDPQTLSSQKMYRLPDGRIFAINANPNMPGGYSATIVAVTETKQPKPGPSKTNASTMSSTSSRRISGNKPSNNNRKNILKQRVSKNVVRSKNRSIKEADLNVPVEWYRYNLMDAIDALEYSLSRLHKLKREATTSFLRTRSVPEMRNLHKTLENLLNTSSNRFREIRETINKELKEYIEKKTAITNSDDDDDVEILPDVEDGPICIDENSLDSFCNDSQEVDLTEGGSEPNDSGDKGKDENIFMDTSELRDTSDELENEKDDTVSVLKDNVKSKDTGEALKRVDITCDEKIENTENGTSDLKSNEVSEKESESQDMVVDKEDSRGINDTLDKRTESKQQDTQPITNGESQDSNKSSKIMDKLPESHDEENNETTDTMNISDDVKENP
ncbi:unnamed protein product [Leptosia nina]|uniref:PHD-type domain-containing protein n=1 Tax=Leptosia nina TaxID=320188 RepID=A0AAV1JR13_9NEOP